MLMVTFHAPHAGRPPAEIHAWWIRFDKLVAAWKCCWETPMGAWDPTSRVLLDQLLQKSKTVQVFYGTSCSSLMPFGFHVQ